MGCICTSALDFDLCRTTDGPTLGFTAQGFNRTGLKVHVCMHECVHLCMTVCQSKDMIMCVSVHSQEGNKQPLSQCGLT